jgi:hypothetical protein
MKITKHFVTNYEHKLVLHLAEIEQALVHPAVSRDTNSTLLCWDWMQAALDTLNFCTLSRSRLAGEAWRI